MKPTFKQYLRAGYPVLYVQTHEEARAVATLAREAEGYEAHVWDCMSGLRKIGNGGPRELPDPVEALKAVESMPEGTVYFLHDMHKFLASVEVYRTLKNLLPGCKATDRHIVLVSPVLSLPAEIEKDVTTYEFKLPEPAEIVELARKMAADNDLAIPVDERVVETAKGLTLAEAENALALSLVTTKGYDRSILEDQKLQTIKKGGLMELYLPAPESDLGGLEPLKKYIHNRKRGFTEPGLPTPKGIILMGPSGTGKSQACKVIASVLDYPLIRLDFSALKGSLVGQSEERLRAALAQVDAVSPCILMLDEMEKAFSGVQSSGKTDGGTTSGMFGAFLTWFQESPTPKFVVGTLNDIDDLLAISQGALLRRFDDLFFVNFPNEQERRDILAIMNRRYNTNVPLDTSSRMTNWSGAEIERFVRASIYDGIEAAFSNIKPVYEQNRERIEKARQWASTNCRMANSIETQANSERKLKV